MKTDERAFLGKLTDDERYFVGSVYDKLYAARDRYRSSFTFFLTEGEAVLAKKVIASERFDGFEFYGGYEGAERVMLGFFADGDKPDVGELSEAFPISALTFRYRPADKLTHRDILGALMSLDIARETVGDILTGSGLAVVFLTEAAAREAAGITKIGRAGVKVSEGYDPDTLPQREFAAINGTVSSLRIDSVLSLAVRCPRSKSVTLISGGAVVLRGQLCAHSSAQVAEGDVFSVRGHGKFRLEKVGATTKKDRIFIEIYKYI